jgi:hypothetical protein
MVWPLYCPDVRRPANHPPGLHDILLAPGLECAVFGGRFEDPAPRRFTYPTPEPIRTLARRAGAMATLEAEEQLDREIENGRGGLYLDLTSEQYRKLTRP